MVVCGGLERTIFFSFATLGICGGHERTERTERTFLTVSNLLVCGGLERADF